MATSFMVFKQMNPQNKQEKMGERRGSERRKFLLHKLEVNNITHLL